MRTVRGMKRDDMELLTLEDMVRRAESEKW